MRARIDHDLPDVSECPLDLPGNLHAVHNLL